MNIAVVAVWISGGSLLVSFVSLYFSEQRARRAEKHAGQAEQQAAQARQAAEKLAKQAATLSHRIAAIEHLREALRSIITGYGVSGGTLTSIQKAMDLSETVFSQQLRNDLKQAIAKVDRQQLESFNIERLQGHPALRKDLENSIARMKQEAEVALVG